MTTSEAIDQLATALAAAQGEVEGAVKDSANPFFKSKYADLASVWEACRGPLSTHGLSVVQSPTAGVVGEEFVVSVETRLLHASGQWMAGTVSVVSKPEPQAVGSAITYLRRYALQSFVGIAPEDDDAEAAHGRGNDQRQGTAAASSGPRAMAKAAAAPKGYVEWLDGLRSVADEGTEALVAAWNKAPVELRRHLTTTQPAVWESLKGTAVHASAKSKPVSA